PMDQARFTWRNPFFPTPPQMVDVASPAFPIFPFVVPETAVTGSSATNQAARPPSPQSNRAGVSRLTSARGPAIYCGNAFPSNYLKAVFIADPSAHVIHRAVLRENGLAWV